MKKAGIALALSIAACGAKAAEGPPVGISTKEGPTAPPPEKSIAYAFDALDERGVSSQVHAGKPTVLAFVTTGDMTSQAQVDFLVAMEKNDGKVVNYALIAIHPRKEIVLVEAYCKTLGVTFPVALGDAAATGPTGPFGEIPAVPTIVVLDRQSRLVWKHTGLAKPDELRARMRGL